MGSRLLLAVALALVLVFDPRAARADDGGAAPSAEIAALEADIARSAAALATGSCVVACEALGAMRRAVTRLCALDPGPRCAEARAKALEATRRVREACPDCAALEDQAPEKAKQAHEQPGEAPAKIPEPAPPPPPPPPTLNESVARRGGCAGCVTSGGDGLPGGAALAALAVLAAVARRRPRGRASP
jgi:MYXO-CTERM domain-containing protein